MVVRFQESKQSRQLQLDARPMFNCVVFFVSGRLIRLTYQSDQKFKPEYVSIAEICAEASCISDQTDLVFCLIVQKLVDRTIVISLQVVFTLKYLYVCLCGP